jgi:hypothetical protein
MSNSPKPPTIAYLAQGRIRLKGSDALPRTIESTYGNSLREKAIRSQQRHSWKSQGDDGSPFKAMLWGKGGAGDEVPLAITSICSGKNSGSLVYSLESGSLCALLESGQPGVEETRLWNDNRTRIRHVSVSRETGDMVFSILHQNGTANIGVKLNGHSGTQELTEGDSFDTAPHWVPGVGKRIVYQSAGVGRNREGQFLALGPFNLQQLDADAGEITTVLEERNYDCLAPQFAPDGALFYIRRPYAQHAPTSVLGTLKTVAMLPFRVAHGLYVYLNLFSAMYTGKKLTPSGGAKAREMDMKQMMIWGNMVRSQRASESEDESADLVPKSWQLIRRQSNGETKPMASGVLAYRVGPDATIVYTNGNAIFLIKPDGGKERILSERMIEQVAWL